MNNLTLLIPTKNEASCIASCILSAKDIVDEIIVIDSYSVDDTVEIAKEYGAKIIQREFDNFSNQKNFAIPQAKNEWILLLDADEQLTEELKAEIKDLVNSNHLNDHKAYWVYRKNYFFERPINYSGFQKDKVIRLFSKNDCQYKNFVHENLVVNGTTGFLNNKLYHNTYKGFDNHVQKLNYYATLQAKDYDKKTDKIGLFHFIIKPGFRFFKHYIIQKGYKDGTPGIIMSFLGSYSTFIRYVKLWMLRNNIEK
ncbi:glycosyltransferase family 2 protein [Myroides injenensis]|uniref:glycosyltransferase family 2 protein n=1 Tax=Myroides injenensis TaxID=1183151 RepID=UPI000288AF13|nr:glycosyltransferase family 2 protein [Myroides injenensis]